MDYDQKNKLYIQEKINNLLLEIKYTEEDKEKILKGFEELNNPSNYTIDYYHKILNKLETEIYDFNYEILLLERLQNRN